MKHLLTILLCISVSAFALPYQEGWYSLDGDNTEREVEVSLMQSDTNCVSVLYRIPGFYLEQDDDSTDYWHVKLKGFYITKDSLGLPQLPIISDRVAIPNCSSVSVTVEYFAPEVVESIFVYPVPEIVEDSMGYRYEFAIDTLYYNSQDTLYPAQDSSFGDAAMRNQKLGFFSTFPFRYNISDEELTVYRQILIKLEFNNPTTGVCVNAGPMNNICRKLLLNSEHIPVLPTPIIRDVSDGSVTYWDSLTSADTTGLDTVSCDYLIIVADTLWGNAWIDTIANFRKYEHGFDVHVVSFDACTTLFSSVTYPNLFQKVWAMIELFYRRCPAHHMADEHLGFVLLLGDANNDHDAYNYLMPAYDMRLSDMYYGDVTSDAIVNPDVPCE